MAYGTDTAVFNASAPVAQVPEHGSLRLQAWRTLDEQSRLQLVERALRPIHDLIDGYPLAL